MVEVLQTLDAEFLSESMNLPLESIQRSFDFCRFYRVNVNNHGVGSFMSDHRLPTPILHVHIHQRVKGIYLLSAFQQLKRQIAKQGYKSLFAYVPVENIRARFAVLVAGFTKFHADKFSVYYRLEL